MPELPDVEVYVERLRDRFLGQCLVAVRVANPFLVRTVSPRPDAAVGQRLSDVSRLGKRLVFTWEGGVAWVLHLMIAGRLKLARAGAPIPGKLGLAAFDFAEATVILTEAGSKRRASLSVVASADAVADFDPGGLEPLAIDPATFSAALTRENHTLKRALTDPRILSGIGNAYSDEILWHAQLSPVTWTTRLSPDELARLYASTREVLTTWTDKLRAEARQSKDGFPDKVTAFREDMAVHGRFGKPCPRCARPVMRIRYADNETNYCPTCQTGGRLLADRGLSRLLKGDWPRTLDELEARMRVDKPISR